MTVNNQTDRLKSDHNRFVIKTMSMSLWLSVVYIIFLYRFIVIDVNELSSHSL